jgi:hypothetical protein
MSSNFLDLSGGFLGKDMHLYYTVAPPSPAPVMIVNVHLVGQFHTLGRIWREVGNVTTEANTVLQSGWAMLLVPHIPLPIPPHPSEVANLATIIATSSSAPQLSAHTVTGKGTALLVAVIGPVGANVDCGFSLTPTGVDLNFNSVKTTPTLGDYLAAAVGAVLNSIYASAVAAVPANGVCLWIAFCQNMSDFLASKNVPVLPILLDPYTWVIGKVTSAVQSAADG